MLFSSEIKSVMLIFPVVFCSFYAISQSNITKPIAICQYNTGATLAVTFASQEDCNQFADTATVGAAGGYSYNNCTVSTYCLTFKTSGVVDLQNRNVAAISGTGVAETTLTFSSISSCLAAVNATASSGGHPKCDGSVMSLPTAGNGDATSFSVSIEDLNITSVNAQYY